MHKLKYIFVFLAVIFNMGSAQNKWIWSKTKANQKIRSDYPLAEELYARANRDREPTTKRPTPGQPQNDDIEDYADESDETTRQHSPYIPPGAVGNPLIPGNFNGFGNYPQSSGFLGNTPNGILVGPGGPTGIIGRPPPQYPAIHTGYPGGYPIPQNFAGPSVNSNSGYSGFNGQYPYANVQQFAGAQYPQTQFPGVQYPHQTPQYTEGYGLANPNHGFNVNPQFNGNFNPNYGFGFDDYPTQVQGKSANIKTINKKVDDKIAKTLKKL